MVQGEGLDRFSSSSARRNAGRCVYSMSLCAHKISFAEFQKNTGINLWHYAHLACIASLNAKNSADQMCDTDGENSATSRAGRLDVSV